MWTYNYSDELYHYGVKGMKWGVRRFQKKDGSLTSAGKKRYSDTDSKKLTKDDESKDDAVNNQENEKRKLTRKQKAVIIGASVVAAYAAYKFIDSGSATRLVAKGKAALGHSDLSFNKNTKLTDKTMSPDEILSTVVKRINPNYGDIGTKNNCRRCTFAYELSRRGYDVKATKTAGGTGQNIIGLSNAVSKNRSGISGYFKEVFTKGSITERAVLVGNTLGEKPITKHPNDRNFAESIFKAISNYENGARGELTVTWSCGGGHSMAWEIVKGKPVIFDCQTGTKYDSASVFEQVGSIVSKASTTRLDNIELNDDFLLKWVKNV